MSSLVRERYGRTEGVRRPVLIAAAALGLLLATAFAAWVAVARQPELTWDDIGYRMISDGEVELTFDVTFTGADAGHARAVCQLQALNSLRTEVGRRDVTVEAGPRGRVRATTTLRTSEPATTALVTACLRG